MRRKFTATGMLETLKRLGADGLDIQASTAITPELGKALRKHGFQFHCWTVNDIALARYMVEMGVDSITTDRPEFLRRGILAEKSEDPILRHFSFDDEISGQALMLDGVNSLSGRTKGTPLQRTLRPSCFHEQIDLDRRGKKSPWQIEPVAALCPKTQTAPCEG